MHENKPTARQMIKLMAVLMAVFTLSSCRSCSSTNKRAEVGPEYKPSPTSSVERENATPTPTASPSPSPRVEKVVQTMGWGTRVNDEAWIDRHVRFPLPMTPGEGELMARDRVGTNPTGQASIRFTCGTIFLFHDTELVPSPCPRASYRSGSCLNGGQISLDDERRTCGRKLVLGTDSVEISLDEVNAAHSIKRVGYPLPGSLLPTSSPMVSTFEDEKGTNVIVHHFPKQRATVVQIRSTRTGTVSVRPVLQAGDRRNIRELGAATPLKQSECYVTQPGASAGPNIAGAFQREAIPCAKNLWPILLELSQRENTKPLTTKNMELITELALRRRQAVPPCELGPCIKVDPLGGKFTDQPVGTQERIALVIENRGKPPLKVDAPVLEGANSSDFEVGVNNCTKPVERVCELNIGFKPSATGPRVATLRIPSNGSNVPTEVLLHGTGTTPPPPPLEMKIDKAESTSFPIQKVGTTTTRQVVLKNTGQATLRVKEILIEGQGQTAFVTKDLCRKPMATDETCTIEVTFAPQTAEGFTAKLSIIAEGADPAASVVRTFTVPPVELRGTGAAPVIKIDNADLCFGKHKVVKESDPLDRQTLTLTVSNSGAVPLNVSNVSVNNEDFRIVEETCKARDVAAGTCRVTVGFTPRKSHLREGILTITHDDKKAGATKIPLKGAGKARNPVRRFFQWIFNRPENPCK